MKKIIWALALIAAILSGHGNCLQCFTGQCSKSKSPNNRTCAASVNRGTSNIKNVTCMPEPGQQMICVSMTYKSILPFYNDSEITYQQKDIDAVCQEGCYSWTDIKKQAPSLNPNTTGCTAVLDNLDILFPPKLNAGYDSSPQFVNATICACNTDSCNVGFQSEDFHAYVIEAVMARPNGPPARPMDGSVGSLKPIYINRDREFNNGVTVFWTIVGGLIGITLVIGAGVWLGMYMRKPTLGTVLSKAAVSKRSKA